jgi:hypothetical protein
MSKVATRVDVLGEIRRDAGWRVDVRIGGGQAFGSLDALLDFAQTAQVLVELLAVTPIEVAREPFGIIQDEIKDGLIFDPGTPEVLGALAGRAGAKEAFENQSRIGFGRQWLSGRTPGQVVAVSARVAGIAIPRLAHAITGEFEGREARQMPDPLGDHLVDGHSGMDVGSGGLLDAHAGKKGPARAGMVTGSVVAGIGAQILEPGNDLELALHGLQGLQRGRQVGHFATFAFRPPGGGDGAVRNI